MKNKFQNTFISAIIISSVSLAVFVIFLNIYKNKNHAQRIKQNNTSEQLIINYDSTQNEIESLKQEIISIKDQDTIQKFQLEKDKMNEEIITYVSSVQKHLYSKEKKDLQVLKAYYFKLREYYKIKGLSVNANRLLIGTIRSLRIEIDKIENELNKKTTNPVEKVKENSTKSDTILNSQKDTDTLTNESNELFRNVNKEAVADSIQTIKNDTVK